MAVLNNQSCAPPPSIHECLLALAVQVPIALLRQRVARRMEAAVMVVVRIQRMFRAKICRE